MHCLKSGLEGLLKARIKPKMAWLKEPMAKWYSKLSEKGRNLFWLSIVYLAIFLCLCPLFLYYDIKGYSYPLGVLLGGAFSVFAYFSIVYQSDMLSKGEGKGTLLVLLFMFGRILGYAAIAVVAGICTFKSEYFGGFDAFNFYSAAGAMVFMPIMVLILGAISKHERKGEKKEEKL